MPAILASPEQLFFGLANEFVYAVLSNAIAKTVITLPIVFTAIGHVCPEPLDALVTPDILKSGSRVLAEITLALALFSDASRVRCQALKGPIHLHCACCLLGCH